MNNRQKSKLIRVGVSGVLILIILLSRLPRLPELIIGLAAYFAVGYDVLLKAWKKLMRRKAFDEHFLMSVATLGALALGDLAEAAAVMLFYQVGELFESIAVGKSRKSISALMDIRPDHANIESETGELMRVDPESVPVGSIIIVCPGERVPIDGLVVSGKTSLDASALTGESRPRDVKEGDSVLSGCIVLSGVIRLKTVCLFGQSAASKILQLTDSAASKKSRTEKFITRFARRYTPAVCMAALAVAVLPPVIRLISGSSPLWNQWIYRALTFLVISCPCAIVISIPLAFFACIGGAGRKGILIKGSDCVEALSRVTTVVLDKTGTLTEGSFSVKAVRPSGMESAELLKYAAAAEGFSSHPIAGCIRAAAGDIEAYKAENVSELSGMGVAADINGRRVTVGSSRLISAVCGTEIEAESVGTHVFVAVEGRYCGEIVINDTVKPSAKYLVERLKSAGIKRLVMLTGDSESVAAAVARKLGIDEYHAELMPEDKLAAVEKLVAKKQNSEALAFVGDGINDAPALARADVGIAMGGVGSDAAVEAADAVLMDDDPAKLALAVRGAKKCMLIAKGNIAIALAVKVLCLGLGAAGLVGMWAAVFADVGVMVICVLNAMRALKIR